MMLTPAIDLEARRMVEAMPTGVISSISFERLVKQLRAAGEIGADQTITHMIVDVEGGHIVYRVDQRREATETPSFTMSVLSKIVAVSLFALTIALAAKVFSFAMAMGPCTN